MTVRWGKGLLLAVALAVAAGGAAPGAQARDKEPGVKVGNPSFVRKLVPAEEVEKVGTQQYGELVNQAKQKGALLPDTSFQVRRIRAIAERILPFAPRFNVRANEWKWEVNVFNSQTINAFCMPGGKIAFFTGILDQLQLTDDEVAMVMGHEIAHALREHARERMAKSQLTNLGVMAVAIVLGNAAGQLAQVGGTLYSLRFSRGDETEADLVGMELAARAGFDPRAGLTLWVKMQKAAKGEPPQWLSTHPSNTTRIETIKKNLPDVLPLYEEAASKRKG